MDCNEYSKIGINRMYKCYNGRLCNEIESEEDVLERLECISCKSRELLEYVWRLKPKYKGKSLEEVEKKLGITRKEAESNFHFGKYLLYFKDYKEMEFKEGIKLGMLVRAYYKDYRIHFHKGKKSVKYMVDSKNFIECINLLKEDYKFVLVQHYGLFGGNPITYAELGKILKISMHAVQTMEDLALRELRLVSFKFLEELDDYYCDLLILVYDKKISKKEYNALRRAGISTYEELKNCAPERLISFSGIGPRMLKNLKEVQKTL